MTLSYRSAARTAPAALVAALAFTALSGCVVAPYSPYRGGYAAPAQAPYPAPYPAQSYGEPAYGEPIAVADLPPPSPYQEVMPAMPFIGAIWLSGYWGWHGNRHEWVGGRWEHGREGYAWSPHRWVPVQGRWHLMGGNRQRR